MGAFATTHQRTAHNSQSLGTVGAFSTRPRRIRHFYMVLGSEATPADAAFLWVVQRCTALGTSTAVTPAELIDGDPVSEQLAGQNHSAEPTYTANKVVLTLPWNRRAGQFKWTPLDERKVITTPATSANGIGIKTPTGDAVAITALLHWED